MSWYEFKRFAQIEAIKDHKKYLKGVGKSINFETPSINEPLSPFFAPAFYTFNPCFSLEFSRRS